MPHTGHLEQGFATPSCHGSMRLLIVSQDFAPRIGGIETFTRQIALRITDPRHTTVLAPLVRGASAVDAELPFRVVRVPAPPNLLPGALRTVLSRLLSREHFDATLHTQWQTARFALSARDGGRVRRVFIATHGRELLLRPHRMPEPWAHAYARRRSANLNAADLVFSVSRYTRDLAVAAGARPERVLVIPNGVDPECLGAGSPDGLRERLGIRRGPMILSVCRLVPRKGVDMVLRCLPEVRRTFPDLVYVVVGDGPERERLQTLADDLGVSSCVRWEGFIPMTETRRFYAACDLFVLTPRTIEPDVEGFGLVYLEAAAAGKPVIASDAGGIPDAVIAEETGLVVPEGRTDRLAESMLRLLQDQDLADRLARNGRQRVATRMTWNAVADRFRDAMSAALSPREAGIAIPHAPVHQTSGTRFWLSKEGRR